MVLQIKGLFRRYPISVISLTSSLWLFLFARVLATENIVQNQMCWLRCKNVPPGVWKHTSEKPLSVAIKVTFHIGGKYISTWNGLHAAQELYNTAGCIWMGSKTVTPEWNIFLSSSFQISYLVWRFSIQSNVLHWLHTSICVLAEVSPVEFNESYSQVCGYRKVVNVKQLYSINKL